MKCEDRNFITDL